MRARNPTGQKWLLISYWLILCWATGCVQGEPPATVTAKIRSATSSPHIITFEASDPAAIAGDPITVHWETKAIDSVTLEVWGFVSYEQPQVQQIISYPHLAPDGNQTITMPGAPSAVYLIIDSSVSPEQSPNISIQLHPSFYQPEVRRFAVSKPEVHPGDDLTVEWESDSIQPPLIKTFWIYQTAERSWSAPAEQFDGLSESGSSKVTVPASERNLVGISFELYTHNNTYTHYISTVTAQVSYP